MPPIQTVQTIQVVTEHYRTAVVEDRFFRRINEQLWSQVSSATERSYQEILADTLQNASIGQGDPGPRAEYRLLYQVKGQGEDTNWYAQILGFNREPEETVQIVELKIPLASLPEGFDDLPQADKDAAVIHYGRTIGWVNWPDY